MMDSGRGPVTVESEIDLHRDLNEALLVSSVRQHRLAETAQKAEAALRQSEERFRMLFDAAPMAVLVCDNNAVIQQFNQQAAQLWGREPICGVEQHCGSLRLWLPDGTRLPHEMSPMAEVLKTGLPALNVEVLIERPDGSRLPVLANFGALTDLSGEITGAITSFTDISNRKAAEAALILSEARFRVMAELMPQKVFTADATGAMTYFNPQWLDYTGLTCDQIGDSGWMEIVHPEELDENIRIWRHSIESGEPFSFEHRFRRADGQYRWHISRALPMRNEVGEVTMWIGSNTDVEDVKRAEQIRRERLEEEVTLRTGQLLESNEQLQGFTYSVAHDLRQQIRGVGANASILIVDARPMLDQENMATLDRLVASSKRLALLVDELLTYARLVKLEVTNAPFDFSALSEEVAAIVVERGICQKGTKFIIERGLTGRGDSRLIRVVMENLLENACKFSKDVGTPLIEVGREGEAYFVRDNGIGFNMQFAHKLFQPFERLHHESVYQGTGIGLASVKRIITKHGGKVWAEGILGEGSTFYFTLSQG